MKREIYVPNLPESVADATVINWHKNPGDAVRQGENLLDLETDKVVLEVPAPEDGILNEQRVQVGEVVNSGQVLALFDTGQSISVAPTTVQPEISAPIDVAMAPSARKLVKALHLDSSAIAGSGRDGRILKTDVVNYLDQQEAAPKNESQPVSVAPSLPEDRMGRPEQRVPMTRLRARVAERLVQAQQTAAILTTFNEVDMQPIMELRNRYQERFEKQHGIRLGFMSFFVKAAVEALQRFPVVNAAVDGNDIVYHGYYDIGIAVSSPRGLVVPILRDCEALTFAEVEKGIEQFGKKAKDGSLSYEELTGGTFSITNGGIFGSLMSTPILNPPQSAILGMHAIKQRPVVVNGEIVARPMMYLALSYDHRLIDGREAVQFLVTIKDCLEDPTRLLLRI